MNAETVNLDQVSLNEANPRTISDAKFEKLVNSILALPKMLSLRPVVVDDAMVALGGNMRLRALKAIAAMSADELRERLASLKDVKKKTAYEQEALADYWVRRCERPTAEVIRASELSEEERREFVIKDNVSFGEWNTDALAAEWDTDDLSEWALDDWETENEEYTTPKEDPSGDGVLAGRFLVPPFSILDTRRGGWQKRKKEWRAWIGDVGGSREGVLEMGIEQRFHQLYSSTRHERKRLGISFKEYLDKYVSEEEKAKHEQSVLSRGVSLFDPVLAEVLCRWFTPHDGARIFDCFAGDTQKGLVFARCGYVFKGVELRPEQVEVNNRVIEGRGLPIEYVCDDGRNVARHFEAESQDLLFSCPPYYDLEVYSDRENDASNQGTYEEFIQILSDAFKSAYACLKDNRFAVLVVGDVRAKKTGAYYDFPGDVKRIFREAGAHLYNEIILVESGASVPLRAAHGMKYRKVGKLHQNILVFYKGDPRKVAEHFPEIDLSADERATLDALIEQAAAVEGADDE